MKKKILLLLLLVTAYAQGQTTLANKLKITGNTTSVTAAKVNVQEADGIINTIAKSDLIEVLEFDSAVSMPITGVAGKIYVTKDNGKIYRWNGTYYTELAITDISGKVDKVAGKSLIADAEIARLSTVVNQDISGKEDSFSKNTAFNKNFGVLANTVSEGNHLHNFSDLQNNPTTIAGYGITDANKSPINVNVTTARTTAAKIGTTSSGTYTPSIGDRIDVTFTLGTAIANATLNIDGSGVKAIQLAGTNVTALSLSTPASLVVIPMYYNGTAWQIYGSTMSADTNTTYIEATTGLAVTASTQAVAVNRLYYADNASNVAFTLPATCAVNSIVHIVGMNSTGTYSVITPSGDNIILEGNDTGAGGILNGSIRSTLVLRCTVANTTWSVVNYTGQIVSNTGYSTNKESTVNKSDSYTVSSTTTYPNTKALVDGLATKSTNIPQLESNSTDLTVWNNGKGNAATNTSFGELALRSNTVTSNSFNSAFGHASLSSNTSGTNNTAIGHNALNSNVGGGSNVAVGSFALSTSNNYSNVAIGNSSLNKTTGNSNSAVGNLSLFENTTGSYNSAVGNLSLFENTTGSYNSAVGDSAGRYISDGITANAITYNSVFLGYNTKALANNQTNQIVIGDNATGAGSNTVTLGNTSITNTILRGTVTTNGSFINSTAPATNVLLAGGTTLANPISGTGTTNYLPKFTSAGVIGNSQLFDSSNFIGIGTQTGVGSDRFSIIYDSSLPRSQAVNIKDSNSSANNGVFMVFRKHDDTFLGAIRRNNTDNSLFIGGNDYLSLGALDSEKMRINSSGNILINTTTDNGVDKLQVNGSALFTGKLKALCPIYANDAAADADATLLSGQFYKLSGSRVVYQKP